MNHNPIALGPDAGQQPPPLDAPPPPPVEYPPDPHGDTSRRHTYLGSVAYAVGSFPLAHRHFCQALHHLLHPDRKQIFAPQSALGMRGDIRINTTYLNELLNCPLLDPERYAQETIQAHQAAVDDGRRRVRMGHHRYGALAQAGEEQQGQNAGEITSEVDFPWGEIYVNMERTRLQQQRRESSASSYSDNINFDQNIICDDESNIDIDMKEGEQDDFDYTEESRNSFLSNRLHVLPVAGGMTIPTLSSQHHRNLLEQIERFDDLSDPILEDAPHFLDCRGDVSSLDCTTLVTSTVTVPSCRPRRVDDADVLLLGIILFDLGLCHLSVGRYEEALELVQMAHSYLLPKEGDRCFEDLVLMMEDDMAVIRDFIRLRSKQENESHQEKKMKELLWKLIALSSSSSMSMFSA